MQHFRFNRGWLPIAAVAAAVAGSLAATREPVQGDFVVCVGADRVLRLEPTGKCPANQTSYRIIDLAGSGPAPGGVSSLEKRLASLEAFVRDVGQKTGNGRKITAPFEVTDGNGKTIFAVTTEPRGFQLFLANGQPVAVVAARAEGDGAYFKAFNPEKTRTIAVGVVENMAEVTLRDGSALRGLFFIDDGGKPMLQLSSRTTPVATLHEGSGGAGHLQLLSPAGTPTVEAGTIASGVGLVRAGPRFTCTGKGGLAAPDCIMGHP